MLQQRSRILRPATAGSASCQQKHNRVVLTLPSSHWKTKSRHIPLCSRDRGARYFVCLAFTSHRSSIFGIQQTATERHGDQPNENCLSPRRGSQHLNPQGKQPNKNKARTTLFKNEDKQRKSRVEYSDVLRDVPRRHAVIPAGRCQLVLRQPRQALDPVLVRKRVVNAAPGLGRVPDEHVLVQSP